MRVFGLLFFFLALPLWGETQLTTQLHEVDYGNEPGDEILVLLTSGHVAKVPQKDKAILIRINAAKAKDKWFTITLDDQRYITGLESALPPHPGAVENLFKRLDQTDDTYVPTTVESMERAQKYHREGRRNPKESQCFNRAIVWGHEWWKKHSLKSMKILIFFTRNYIRRYDFEWWFHISPYIHVMENGKVVERVMDLKYTSRPLEFRKWTDIFMKNNAECPVITKYSEYADYPYSGECFIIRTNMYTYQPADLQMLEAWGYKKDRFNMDEVKGAYLEAFDVQLYQGEI